MIRLIYACDISEDVVCGCHLRLWHNGLGVVIGAGVVIGNNVEIFQNVTIGNKDEKSGAPSIGDGVKIGAGAAVLGNITVGDNVFIGANSVVIHDVPDNVKVAGVPARIIGRRSE